MSKNEFTVTIAEAAKQLEDICKTYFEKNDDGECCIPINRQRPIMLIGPAGIGKTDIPRRTAQKLGIGFISYSITHHTRQSLIGLPKIIEKTYGGDNMLTTEYTASEIIAAVYRAIEEDGNDKGILFIDEVNCVSETLAAPLLQLFQNKTFGQRKIPDGWILVMAGNPPEYNKSVKEFDAVTRDRLRVINVVPDTDAWLEYALQKGLNGAVISYIECERDNLYVFNPQNGEIATPRGWEELSINIDAYVRNGIDITEAFVAQFINSSQTALDFYNYYSLINGVISKKEIDEILDGTISQAKIKRITACKKDTKYFLTLLLKRKLHTAAVEDDIKAAGKKLDNIVSFIKKAYGKGSEIEIFMSNILTDTEIVKMTVKTGNEYFAEFLRYITGAKKELLKQINDIGM